MKILAGQDKTVPMISGPDLQPTEVQIKCPYCSKLFPADKGNATHPIVNASLGQFECQEIVKQHGSPKGSTKQRKK